MVVVERPTGGRRGDGHRPQRGQVEAAVDQAVDLVITTVEELVASSSKREQGLRVHELSLLSAIVATVTKHVVNRNRFGRQAARRARFVKSCPRAVVLLRPGRGGLVVRGARLEQTIVEARMELVFVRARMGLGPAVVQAPRM